MHLARSLILASFLAAAAPAAAQDVNADPNFRTINLRTGFTPDPQTVSIRSGGEINASSISSACVGFISSAPDVRLNYTAGTLPLILSVAASADTTLVVNGPNGSWYCDDDGGVNGNNPMVRFNAPQSGRYEIWIGTYGNSSLQPGQLNISELTSQ
jgi:hypothetical protein